MTLVNKYPLIIRTITIANLPLGCLIHPHPLTLTFTLSSPTVFTVSSFFHHRESSIIVRPFHTLAHLRKRIPNTRVYSVFWPSPSLTQPKYLYPYTSIWGDCGLGILKIQPPLSRRYYINVPTIMRPIKLAALFNCCYYELREQQANCAKGQRSFYYCRLLGVNQREEQDTNSSADYILFPWQQSPRCWRE